MTAWVRGSKMDAGAFASHFFGRAADDPVVATLRAAVSEASFATTQAHLAKASGDLAEVMKAVGLDRWPRFVADAQARARDPATVAAIEKSLQPPDLKRNVITPVYPVEKALAVTAAAATGGVAGLVGGVARAIGGAVAGKILGDKPAPPATAPPSPLAPEKEVVPEKPAEGTKRFLMPKAASNDPSAASVLDKLYRYTLNPDHADGKDKADWFRRALGFTRANISDLAKQIVFDESRAIQTSITEWGTKYNQTIAIVGANGRTLPVLTAWIRGTDGVVRLVTAIPGK
jgi:hypothetical protein